MPQIMCIDLETFSSAPLPKCGVYRYVDSPDFEILLLSYAFDDEPVQTIDLACGEQLPPDVFAALEDPAVIKMTFNAQFERVCLSKHLGHWLDPAQWRCTAVMASYLTLPPKLGDVAVILNLTQKKMDEGRELVKYFSVPCKATKVNGGRTRNLSGDAPEKWETFKAYNIQDVETERAVRKALEAYPLPEHEWELYALDQIINDRGVLVDQQLIQRAIQVDRDFTKQAINRAREISGLENPGSVAQLKKWLVDQDHPMESLGKKLVQEKVKASEGVVNELLSLRLELSKASVKKYEAMARTICNDGRIHGLIQYYGANRTGRMYIGYTSLAPQERWRKHKNRAKDNPQIDHPFYREIHQYGAENFQLEVLDSVQGLMNALNREKMRIAECPAELRLNLSPGGMDDARFGRQMFWERMAAHPEEKAAYLKKLSEVKKSADWTDYELLSQKSAAWRAEHPREMYKQAYRAIRMSRRGKESDVILPAETQEQRKQRLMWRYKRGEMTRQNAIELWKNRSPEERADIGRKMATAQKKRCSQIVDPAERRAMTEKARAGINREIQGPAASKGIKQFWVDLRKDPERYRNYMEQRTATLRKTLQEKKNANL